MEQAKEFDSALAQAIAKAADIAATTGKPIHIGYVSNQTNIPAVLKLEPQLPGENDVPWDEDMETDVPEAANAEPVPETDTPDIPLPPPCMGTVQPGVKMPTEQIAQEICSALNQAIEDNEDTTAVFTTTVRTPKRELPSTITIQASKPKLVMMQNIRIIYERH